MTKLTVSPAPPRDRPLLCLCAGLKPGYRLKRVSASCLEIHICWVIELKLVWQSEFRLVGLRVGVRFATANDPKLSDRGVRRGTCLVGGKAAVEAGAVTHGAVRCSAWLGDVG